MKKMKAIEAVIEKLNSPKVIHFADNTWMEFASDFKFTVRENDGHIEIFDANEAYWSGYADESYCLAVQGAEEFGFEPPKYSEFKDSVHEALEKAVKKDFGKDAYLEWYDSVIMWVCE